MPDATGCPDVCGQAWASGAPAGVGGAWRAPAARESALHEELVCEGSHVSPGGEACQALGVPEEGPVQKTDGFSLMDAGNLLVHRRQINRVEIGRIDFEYWSTNGEGCHSASGHDRSELGIIKMISVTRMALR